ncbi:MAG: hypothetical protein ACTSRS_19055 [Candidatus Helarchaeota archaeon]
MANNSEGDLDIFQNSDMNKIKISGILSGLCTIIPFFSGIILGVIYSPDFEMRYSITTYSVLYEILGILSTFLLQFSVIVIGLRILTRNRMRERRLLILSSSFIIILLLIEPIQYLMLASGIDWALTGVNNVELLKLAIFSNSLLLILQVVFAIVIFGLTLAFGLLLLNLGKNYSIQNLKIAGILYFFQIAYSIAILLILLGNIPSIFSTDYTFIDILTGIAWFPTYISFLILGTELQRFSTNKLEEG